MEEKEEVLPLSVECKLEENGKDTEAFGMLQTAGEELFEHFISNQIIPEARILEIRALIGRDIKELRSSAETLAYLIYELICAVHKRDNTFFIVKNFCTSLIGVFYGDSTNLHNIGHHLLHNNYSYPQQELLVYVEAEIILVSSGKLTLSLFWSLSCELLAVLQEFCSIDEESSNYWELEYVRTIIARKRDSLSLPMKYSLASYLLRILYCGFPDGVFQKRSTSRSRVLGMLNLLKIPLLNLLDVSGMIEVETNSEEEEDVVPLVRYMGDPIGSAILAFIVFTQQFPYSNYPKVWSFQYCFTICCNSIISMMLCDNPTTKQASFTLFTRLLRSIPPRSYDVSICPYSFHVHEYFGFLTMFTLLTHIYYVTFVQWGQSKEIDASLMRNLSSPIFRHIVLFEGIISRKSLFLFLTAAVVNFLDQCIAHGIVPPEEEAADENAKLMVHRGEAILSVNSITDIQCSLLRLNYGDDINDMLLATLKTHSRIVGITNCMYYTSYLQVITYFAFVEIQSLKNPIDPETERQLKCLSLALMKVLYVIPEEISYVQLEMLVHIVRYFELLSELGLTGVVAYVKRHIHYLIKGLQRCLTNLRDHNQVVMLWYYDSGTCGNLDDQSISSAVSHLYQYLSLLSYSYGFSVVL